MSYYGLPHLDPHMAGPALGALLRHLGTPLLLHSVPVGGPLWKALELAAGPFAAVSRWKRASLAISGAYTEWFELELRA